MITEQNAVALAKELNFLLWTVDTTVAVEADLAGVQKTGSETIRKKANMQWEAHALICSALVLRSEDQVVRRAGSALVVYPELPRKDRPHLLLSHGWIVANAGLIDVSLNLAPLSSHKPIVFENKNLPDPSWKVVFRDDVAQIFEAATKSHAGGKPGVFYVTSTRKVLTREEVAVDLKDVFPAAEKLGISLQYLQVFDHCEKLLSGGETMSVSHLPQEEAWGELASREVADFG